jgi:hypothetical protein
MGKQEGAQERFPHARDLFLLSAQMPFGLEASDGPAAFIKSGIVKPCNPFAP